MQSHITFTATKKYSNDDEMHLAMSQEDKELFIQIASILKLESGQFIKLKDINPIQRSQILRLTFAHLQATASKLQEELALLTIPHTASISSMMPFRAAKLNLHSADLLCCTFAQIFMPIPGQYNPSTDYKYLTISY